MKFGKTLPRNQVPEWSSSYINYKGLKKGIKAAAAEKRAGKDADLAPFIYSLERSIETVDSFFNNRLSESQRRLKLLRDRYGDHFDWTNMTTSSSEASNTKSENYDNNQTKISPESYGLDRDDMSELLGALLELRSSLRKLQWYGDVNRRGFIKVLKKCDKKTGSSIQRNYLESKVFPKPFASATDAITAMQTVNSWLAKISGPESIGDSDALNAIDFTSHPALRRVSSGIGNGLSSTTVDRIDRSIREDDADGLSEVLSQTGEGESIHQRLQLNLLQRAISNRAFKCIDVLLGSVVTLDEEDDINGRNIIHRLVISIGRTKGIPASNGALDAPSNSLDGALRFIMPATNPATSPPQSISIVESDGTLRLSADDESVMLLDYVLSRLRPAQRVALKAKDSHGRLALHYAAQYGFVVICRLLIKYMREWDQFDVSDGIDSPEWQDNDGLAPLHLAVIGQHPKTTRTLLEAESGDGGVGTSQTAVSSRKMVSKSSAVLTMAVKTNSVNIVKLLVEAGVDLNYQDEYGETALHHAARLGHVECVKVLLAGNNGQAADVSLAEKTYGWTALFIAAVEGKSGVAQVLVEIGGCDVDRLDSSGWTAIEHAALRGHLVLAKQLSPLSTKDKMNGNESSTAPITSTIENGTSSGSLTGSLSPSGSTSTGAAKAQTVKSFGHRYLKKDESMVLVTLGSMDLRKNIEPVKLEQIPVSEAHSTQLDTALSLVITAQNAIGEPTVIDLPLHSTVATDDPIVFKTADPTKVKVMFDIVPTYSGSKDRPVGRAVALLNSVKTEVGEKRASLQGGIQVPILAVTTLDIIGYVNFEFMVVKPFEHPNVGVTQENTYWKSLTTPKVIGHRGLGKNLSSRKSLQLGENTLLSFIAAAKLGASYIEFDVQLTKDHVPVIYHDFLVGETGIDAPVHTMTLEQFMSMKQEAPHESRSGSPDQYRSSGGSDTKTDEQEGRITPGLRRTRSMTLNKPYFGENDGAERMKHTKAFRKNGFKGNSRGFNIQAPFATLEETFKALEPQVGFNIELKYPTLIESEEEEMDTSVIEMNAWVDAVLKVVYDNRNGRDLIFSSFNPDICLMLSLKQPSIPILFLTEGGTRDLGDVRTSSLQEAIRFGSRWNLLGIVSAAEPFILCPRLIRVVKESGLLCFTYGTLNNDPANVKLQWKHGVDAVIVDKVLAIGKELRPATEDEASGNGDIAGALEQAKDILEASSLNPMHTAQ